MLLGLTCRRPGMECLPFSLCYPGPWQPEESLPEGCLPPPRTPASLLAPLSELGFALKHIGECFLDTCLKISTLKAPQWCCKMFPPHPRNKPGYLLGVLFKTAKGRTLSQERFSTIPLISRSASPKTGADATRDKGSIFRPPVLPFVSS